jgi:hypothetical protein
MALELDKKLFKIIAPEFANISNTTLNTFEELAILYIQEDLWGSKASHGIALLVAHFLTLSNRKGQGGAITEQKVGDLARSFSHGDTKDALDYTSYGQQFKAIRKTLQISPIMVA